MRSTALWHLIAFPAVAVVHLAIATFYSLLTFVVLGMIGERHPVSHIIDIGFVILWYPLIALDCLGVKMGPIDGGRAIVANTLIWTSFAYPLWVVTARWRKEPKKLAAVLRVGGVQLAL